MATIDCTWCDEALEAEPLFETGSVTCPGCSVVVELAADAPVALAAAA